MLYNQLVRLRVPTCLTKGSFFRLMSSSQTDNHLLIKETSNKAVITLNRPDVLNAVSKDMVRRIYKILKDFEKSKMLVIMKGAGDRSFSVGGDIKSITEGDLADGKNILRQVYTTNFLIRNYKIPYIAFIDGLTMGGGVGLSVHGKYCIATERTILAMPETAIGLFPDIGSSYFLSRLNGKLGMYLGLTGWRLRGEEVVRAGLATHFCNSSKLDELEAALLNCNDLNAIPSIVNRFASKVTQEYSFRQHTDAIDKCFAGKTVEEIFQNLERNGSEWAHYTIKVLKQMSPLSLKLTHRQLTFGESFTLAQALKMEYRMVCRCLENSNFKEGVRALIVDKDRMPKWNPSTIEGVSNDLVLQFFAKLPNTEELYLET